MLPLPQLSWPERADREQEQVAVDRICALLETDLPPLQTGQSRLLMALPTPAPYHNADASLLNALPPGAQVRPLSWPPNGRCYVAQGLAAWRSLLPLLFGLGPPELTLLVLQGDWRIEAPAGDLLRAMQSTLADQSSAGVASHAGLHFDSGDLHQRF